VEVVAANRAGRDLLGLAGLLLEEPMLERAASAGRPVYLGPGQPGRSSSLVGRLGFESGVVVVPLLGGQTTFGFLFADRDDEGSWFGEEELEVLSCVGVLAGELLAEQRLREELQRRDVAKTEFVALASHELRTPISAVYGILATLHTKGSSLREQQRVELRATAFGQAERLRTLADQLLDLSKLDAASVKLNPEATGVRRALEEIVLLVAEIRASEIAIEADPRLEVCLDRTAFDRIVSNLVINALRYGAPPVRVEASRDDQHLRLAVRDCGSGVPAEFVDSLFERFSRAKQPASRFSEGSGLGLAIARSYARAHGGDIVYSDADPHGARFDVAIVLH